MVEEVRLPKEVQACLGVDVEHSWDMSTKQPKPSSVSGMARRQSRSIPDMSTQN